MSINLIWNWLFYLTVIGWVASDLQVLEPTDLQGNYEAPTYFYSQERDFIVNGTVVVPDPKHMCRNIRNGIEGQIVIAYRGGGCSYEDKLRKAIEFGAIGVLNLFVGPEPTFLSALIKDGSRKSDLTIPAIMIESKIGQDLAKRYENGETVRVIMTDNKSKWIKFTDGPIFITWLTVVIFLQVFCFCWAGFKLYFFLKANFHVFALPPACLALEMISAFFRAIAGIDFLYHDQRFTYTTINFLTSINLPFTIATTLLITFYWVQITQNVTTRTAGAKLNKLKYPFIITTAFVFVAELVIDTIVSLNIDEGIALAIKAIIYLLIQAGVSLFFIIAGSILLRQLSKGRAKSRKITIKVIASTVGRFAFIIGVVLLVTDVYQSIPGVMVAWSFMIFGTTAISIAQIWVFKLKSKRKDGSTQEQSKSVEEERPKSKTIELSQDKSNTEKTDLQTEDTQQELPVQQHSDL